MSASWTDCAQRFRGPKSHDFAGRCRSTAEDRSRVCQLPVAACHGAEAIVLCLGEAANMSGEAASRAHPDLPGQQRALAEAVFAHARSHGIPVIAVLFSGRPLVIPVARRAGRCAVGRLVPGQRSRQLDRGCSCGRESPSGRTPISWPRAVGQIPMFFGQRPGGRPANGKDPFTSRYLDEANEPLFPFGHGLTYGRFSLANLRVSPRSPGEADTIEIQVDVTNEGAALPKRPCFCLRATRWRACTRPLLELKGVGKITLGPGETRHDRACRLPAAELRFLGAGLRPVFEPGEIEILVGPCAERSRLLCECVRLRGASDSGHG